MKRYLTALLAVLLLAGCAGNAQPDLDQTEDFQAVGKEQTLYVPKSAAEQQTHGAVTMYTLPREDVTGLAAVGNRLLLKMGTESPLLMTVSLDGGVPSGPIPLPSGFDWDGVWMPTNNGLIYHDAQTHQAVVLDQQLNEWKRIALPEMDSPPVFTEDNARIFYCKGQEIHALELDLGIDRLIRTHTCRNQSLVGSLLSGKVLICQLEDENGQARKIYISSENGQSLSENQGVLSITSGDTYYWATVQEGTLKQQRVGSTDGRPMTLHTGQGQTLRSALELDGVLGFQTVEDKHLALSFYDLKTGKLGASVTVRGVGTPEHYWADVRGKSIWFLSADPATDLTALFRWDVSKSSVGDGASCVTSWYDAENPDTEGIKQLQSRADKLGKSYGVNIRIWQDALKSNDRYVLEPEHQTTAISEALDELEGVLAAYPEKFLSKSTDSKLRICILRSISREITGAQLWSGSDPYIFLSVGCDMEREFAKALGYVVTSRSLGNITIMDDWQSLNPQEFQYGTTPDKSLLEGQSRAFVDAEAATSVTEDRSRTFWRAMQPNNEKLFESEIMQKKLTKLSLAIRDAYSMKKRTEVFPWEQYLHTPIAYVKK
ncbi:MAG: lipoprotein [Oscillospiraceae bacterium]|nr:lipoprotein [Oscillospiraceae bacterium]